MEKSVLDRRLEQLKAEGVEFRTSVEIGFQLKAEELRAQFDVIGLAIGAEQPRDLKIPGRELRGIHFAMDYLIEGNRTRAGDALAGTPMTAQGKNVIIIGGGDTGSDCLGTAHRQGALSIRQFEILAKPPEQRDTSTPWPDWPLQLRSSHAHEEGGKRQWRISTEEFLGKDGEVVGLRARHLDDGDIVDVPVELVLLAAGFTGVVASPMLRDLGVDLTPRGTIRIDERFMTTAPGVFASGDAARGASLIVWAIAEGRKMAEGIDSYLMKQSGLTDEASFSLGKKRSARVSPDPGSAPAFE
jgi:glutamate synthase (NADPH/NADH) small chain